MQPRPQQIQLAAFRRIFLNMTIAIALFAVVLLLVLPTQWVSDPLFVVSLVVSAATVVLVPFVGRVPALPATLTTDEAREAGLVAFRRGLFLRFPVAEVGALFGMAISFAVGST